PAAARVSHARRYACHVSAPGAFPHWKRPLPDRWLPPHDDPDYSCEVVCSHNAGGIMKKTTAKKATPRKLTLEIEALRNLVLGGGVNPAVDGNETRQVSICPTLCTNVVDGCPIIT